MAIVSKVGHNIIIAAAVVAALSTLIGAPLFVDARYAHASDVKESQAREAAQTRLQITQIRIDDLEDKLFALESKAKKSLEDAAMIERYKRRLDAMRKDK